jgi:O-antigen/teichoic acid export membrane protein
MLKKNITANFLGQTVSTGIGFVFIPIYINYLGVEAYGLIGLFSLVTAWLGLLDAGLSSALAREMALFSAGKHTPHAIRTLLKSIEWFFVVIGVLILLTLVPASDWISLKWIKSNNILPDIVKKSIFLMGSMFAIKFFESIYKNAISGLQHQVAINRYEIVVSILRALGAVLLLKYISPNILLFFIWQAILSLLYAFFLKFQINKRLPQSDSPVAFSFASLLSIKSFAGGMLILVFLSLFQTQIDKLLLSKILSLEAFGFYSLSFTAAGALMIFTSPVSQALYPRMNQLYQLGEFTEFKFLYHIGNQIILILLGSASFIIVFFPKIFLFFWTNNQLIADNSYIILSIASLGFFFSGINTMSFSMLLTFSWMKKITLIKCVTVFITIPLLLYFVPIFGSLAAAIIWVIVSLINHLLTVWMVFQTPVFLKFSDWFLHDILYPLIPIILILSISKKFIPEIESRPVAGCILLILFCLSASSSFLVSSQLRSQGIKHLKNLFIKA